MSAEEEEEDEPEVAVSTRPSATSEETPEAPTPTPKKSAGRPRRVKTPAKDTKAPTKEKEAGEKVPKVPRRPALDPARARLLLVRAQVARRRPLFVRQATHRYWRIGRRQSWRHPRGIQSKQRRHYGYRAKVVSVGYRSPAQVRGLAPTGFAPVIVHTSEELHHLNVQTEAAILARTLGTRKRLILEETARKLGVKILNPLVKEERKEE
jgi:large subunit ribosomal protein L32e